MTGVSDVSGMSSTRGVSDLNGMSGLSGVNVLSGVSVSPRDEALLITRQRPKGLKVVSYPRFSIDSENPFLGGQSLWV